MSEPSTDADPLPQRADIPVQRLSRPAPNYSRRISHNIGQSFSQSTALSGDGAGSSSSSSHGARPIPKPAAAVTRPNNSISDTNNDLIASIEGSFSQYASKTTPSKPQIDQFHPEQPGRNPYEPSKWNKITETFATAPYVAKVSIYKTLTILWNLPDHIVRTKRRIFAPAKPKPRTLPAPATISTNYVVPPAKTTRKVFLLELTMETWQFYGFLFTLALNGGFAYWVWVHVHVYLDPHTWRLRPMVTSTVSTWMAFTSLEIWVAVMLGIWNLGGMYLIFCGLVFIVDWIYKYSGLKWLVERNKKTPRQQTRNIKPDPPNWVKGYMTTGVLLWFLILILWPILASTIPAPRLRVDRYPKRCEGGDWDFRVVLDGRVQPKNLTRGRVTVRELKGTIGREVVYVTDGYVNTTWMRTEEKVVLKRMTMPPKEGGVYVIEVTYRFPYMETLWEKAGWNSLPDVRRDRGGNYTVILTDSGTGQNQTINGRFPYLDDQSGLRLDELALIPDVKRSWRSVATLSDNCPWGPDAKLLENTDVGARNMVGEGYPVLQTDMTKFGECSELTVCANRRRQVVDGLPWARGEEGKKVLDAMLIVPLGLILVEQIRWGSCCGDGFAPYRAGPEPTSSTPLPATSSAA